MKLSICFLVLLPLFTFSQDKQLPVNGEGKISYTDVVQVDSTEASALFGKARLFITKAYINGKMVTDLTDIENKTVVTRGWVPVTLRFWGIAFPYKLWSLMIVQCKDNRYKYSFEQFEMEYDNGHAATSQTAPITTSDKPRGWNSKTWQAFLEDIDMRMRALILALKKQMSNKAESDF